MEYLKRIPFHQMFEISKKKILIITKIYRK